MGLDLSNTHDTVAKEDEGVTIPLYDEAGDPYMDGEAPVTAKVAGTYSKRFTKAQAKIAARRARAAGRATPEDHEADARAAYAAAVISWDLVIGDQMAPPEKIFALKPHIYEQIVRAANDHAAFFAQRSTT